MKEEPKTQPFKSHLAEPPKPHVSMPKPKPQVQELEQQRIVRAQREQIKKDERKNAHELAITFERQAEYGRMRRIEQIARSNKDVAWLLAEHKKTISTKTIPKPEPKK